MTKATLKGGIAEKGWDVGVGLDLSLEQSDIPIEKSLLCVPVYRKI